MEKTKQPLIVQSDMTMLLEVESEFYEEVRDSIAPFSEIIKSPEHIHTYKISAISLWNAASSGMTTEKVIETLKKYSKFDVPEMLIRNIRDLMSRYGKIKIKKYNDDELILTFEDEVLMNMFLSIKEISNYFKEIIGDKTVIADSVNRGPIKQAFIKEGFPIVDLAGYTHGETLDIDLLTGEDHPESFNLRKYQLQSRDEFYKGGSEIGGSGVIVLPCGAGKTIVGISIISLLKTHTLILTTGNTSIAQWKRELLEKTNISEDDIGEYVGSKKEIKPITLTSYQIMTYRKKKDEDFIHFQKFNNNNWGLIIYDEVHLLPAQVFRFTSSLQSIRRLGLTATLIREDGREDDVFSLIGPKCFDAPWHDMEAQGWIAKAVCHEIRVAMDYEFSIKYATSDKRRRFRVACENPRKLSVIEKLIEKHKGESILIIGQYIDQLEHIKGNLKYPIITGKTKQKQREELYHKFRSGEEKILIVSSVANFAVDLPDASVAIQISGKFGSRQEEAQRLGRILRPKQNGLQASFYTIVSSDTVEQDYALKRQLFLIEQGYSYKILNEYEVE